MTGPSPYSSLTQAPSLKRRLDVEMLERPALRTAQLQQRLSASGAIQSPSTPSPPTVGDIFVTGEYQGAANFGSGYAPNNTPNGNTDAFVVKYSPAGAVLWYTEIYDAVRLECRNPLHLVSFTTPPTRWSTSSATSARTVDFNNFPGSSHDFHTASLDSSSGDDDSDPYIVALNASNGHDTDFDDFALTNNETISVTSSQVTADPAGDSVYVAGFYSGGSITVSDNSGNDTTFPGNAEAFIDKFGANNFSLNPNNNDWAVATWNNTGWLHGWTP